MEKNEYFQEISEKVAEKREKSVYSEKEKKAYYEGKKEAYSEMLTHMHPDKHSIYSKEKFSPDEMKHFCYLNIDDLLRRLKLARKTYLSQIKLLKELTQLTID